MGECANATVAQYFLLTDMIEQESDLFSAFEPQFAVNHKRLAALNRPASGG